MTTTDVSVVRVRVFLSPNLSFGNTIHYHSNQRRSESRIELYSNEEVADMQLVHEQTNRNRREGERLHIERYPNS